MRDLILKLKRCLMWALIADVLICIVLFLKGKCDVKTALELSIGFWGAVGTVGAVIWALLADEIKRKYEKAKLEIRTSNKSPHCYLVGKNELKQNADAGRVVEIYVEVYNQSEFVARNCQVVCGTVYASTADKDFSCVASFCQTEFKWLNGSIEVDVPRSIRRFCKIAVIAADSNVDKSGADTISDTGEGDQTLKIKVSPLPKEKKTKGSENPPKTEVDSSYLSLRVNLADRAMRREYQSFDPRYHYLLLPLRIVCAGQDAELRYVKIKWEGTKLDEFKEDGLFDVVPLSKEVAERLIKPGQLKEE